MSEPICKSKSDFSSFGLRMIKRPICPFSYMLPSTSKTNYKFNFSKSIQCKHHLKKYGYKITLNLVWSIHEIWPTNKEHFHHHQGLLINKPLLQKKSDSFFNTDLASTSFFCLETVLHKKVLFSLLLKLRSLATNWGQFFLLSYTLLLSQASALGLSRPQKVKELNSACTKLHFPPSLSAFGFSVFAFPFSAANATGKVHLFLM